MPLHLAELKKKKKETKAKVEEPKQENAPKKRGRPRKVVTQ